MSLSLPYRARVPKIVFVLAAALVVGLTVKLATPEPQSESVYSRAQRSTALVATDHGQGSAVILQRRNPEGKTRVFAWTAAHVVDQQNSIRVINVLRDEDYRKAGEAVFNARVVAICTNYDLALLMLDCPANQFLPAEFEEFERLRPGDIVFAVGNFHGRAFDDSVSVGVISQLNVSTRFWLIVDQSTAPAYPGSSGGPVFNSAGAVVGLTVGGVNSTLNFFVPARAVIMFADRQCVGWAVRGDRCPFDTDIPVVVFSPAKEVVFDYPETFQFPE